MTNRFVLKKYICGLLARLTKSSDSTDKEIYKYLAKKFVKVPPLDNEIRRMGESPGIHWKHNVHPARLKELVGVANKRKKEAGFARRIILTHVTM